MDRTARWEVAVLAISALSLISGCVAEEEPNPSLRVDGRVTYRGVPVKKGSIHFLPFAPGEPPASGSIREGEIVDVYTRAPGDGIKAGKYRLAVTAFNDEFLESVAKRGATGPDPVEVGKAAEGIRKLIPPRYSNPRESGQTANLSRDHHTIQLDMVD